MNSNLVDKFYPIGSIYFTVIENNPSSIFGGTWQRIAQGKTLIGVDEDDTDFSNSKKSGGEKSVTLTINEIPSHGHVWSPKDLQMYFTTGTRSVHVWQGAQGTSQQIWTSNVGGGAAHNNLQPYFTCYIWERIA